MLLAHHLPMMRSGAGQTFLRWVRTLPDEVLVGRPDLAAAAALIATVQEGDVLEQRRFLQLIDDAGGPTAATSSLAELEMVLAHAFAVDHGVTAALREGREALRIALTEIEEASSGSLAAYARVLFLAGKLPEAAAMAARMLADPKGRRRTPSLVHALTTMALVEVEQGRIASARVHAAQAKAAAGSIRTNRSWLGGNACLAVGVTLAAEGKDAEAEHELMRAERLFRAEIATIHHTLVLLLLARVRVARGQLDGAQEALSEARAALEVLPDSGRVGEIAHDVEGDARGRAGACLERGCRQASQRGRAERPRAALDGPLGTRDRGAAVPLPQHGQDAPSVDLRQARRAHPRRRDRTGDGSSPVRGRSFTQVRSGRAQPTRAPSSAWLWSWVLGRIPWSSKGSSVLAWRWRSRGCRSRAREGRTTLTGPVRDQSELQGLLQRVSDLGLTLVEVTRDRQETEGAPV